MNLSEVLEKLKENEETKSYAEVIQAEITKKNEEAKKYRLEKSDLNSTLQEILKKVGAEKPKEVIEKVETSSNEISALTEKISNFEKKLREQEEQKLKLELENKIVSKLKKFKVNKNFDFYKDSLVALSTVGESGEILVKNKTIDDYIQNMIDSDVSIIGQKEKSSKQNNNDLYTEEELSNLSLEEIEKNKDKVDRSLRAL